ncbi:MAG TPA: type VI secretion system-associated FHA domain protein TagH [Steroidobacteraceae bacterium]|nr:type VI secretion system-associated FHA domain protein TagH [Steroidobacteraceae bacterium]
MAIKLRVISEHQRELGSHRSRVFGVNGGTVGRAPDNDWVLPDPRRVISGHHCVVQYHGGKYWLQDISTNGVYVNDADDPVSATGGRVELRDGDRLRIGDYDIAVAVDQRIDFLPGAGDEASAALHLDAGIGHQLDLDSLLTPRHAGDSGSLPLHNAFGVKVDSEARAALLDALRKSTVEPAAAAASTAAREDSIVPGFAPMTTQPFTPAGAPTAAQASPDSPAAGSQQPPEWALRTRQVTREELAEALARRQSRADARERAVPFYQQASTWADLRSAVQAFCRGAGIDPGSLTPEAQAMLPLVAGQLLREAVVGLNDIALARASGPAGTRIAAVPTPPGGSSNPLRAATSVEQALQRLFESHNRLYAGPVDSLRDVLQETKEHEAALAAGMRAGLAAVLEQLSPANVADQFEQGRARMLAPGQDPRPKYWEFYADFYHVLKQQAGPDELPHAFVEAFGQEYARSRASLRARRT